MPVSGLTGWYSACGVATAVSALLVGLSVRKVRRVALRQMSGEGAAEPLAARQTQKGGEQQAGARDLIRPITGSPVAWRELRTHLTTRPVAAGCLCWLAFGLLVLAAFATTYSTGRYSALHPVLLSLLVGAGALATLVAAATGVASEKEAGTWPVLLATPLTAGEILLGKIAGVLRRSAPVWAFPIAYLPIFVLMRGAHPVVVPMIGLVALGMAVFVTGSGLLIGVMVCRATTAVALNLCLAAALWIAAPYLLRTLNDGSRGNEGALALAARVVNPLGTVAMVAEGNPSGGTFGGISNDVASYQWCPRAMCHSAIETLGLIFCVAAVHATAGLGMAIVAGVLIRPRAP